MRIEKEIYKFFQKYKLISQNAFMNNFAQAKFAQAKLFINASWEISLYFLFLFFFEILCKGTNEFDIRKMLIDLNIINISTIKSHSFI